MTVPNPSSQLQAFSVFDYFDYRLCLDDFYRYRKSLNTRFSHRSFALKAGYKSSGLFIQIVKGKLNLTRRMLPGFVKAMGLDESQAVYFEMMIPFTHARNAVARQHWFDKMVHMLPMRAKPVAVEQIRYYEKWYHVAVREALSILDVAHDCDNLARFIRPPISPVEAESAMRLLEELALIRRDADGHWRATDALLESTADLGEFLIHSFQESMIDLGKSAIGRFGKDKRNVSCFTFSLSEEGHRRLSLKVNAFHREVSELVRSDEGMNRVCQLNIQYFPLSEEAGTGLARECETSRTGACKLNGATGTTTGNTLSP